METNNYDIIIIGGGLLGCATAYQLARRKAGSILLLDGNDIASQASSRAACLLTRARTKPGLMEIVQETYDCIEEIEAMTGCELGLQTCGSVTMASSDASLRGLEQLEQAATRFGIPNGRIDHKRLSELLPWINADAVGAASYMPTDAFIDSASLCQGYAHAASQLGVTLQPNRKVAGITVSGGRITGVRLADGTQLTAGTVVNAAGAWANLLMRPLQSACPSPP